ncbi:MATE family efflux transporter [Veillonella atypica]|uniref:MATE family efflux transporter n=1 Tax=Veillonella atypica TaxID=39777 RepID=UPI0009E0ED92|nr:MATE family efflux transporter [Veillonella atypica]ARF99807.1 MATE family efflux transporter [Veillonella atypica]
MKTYEKGISLSIWTLSWPIFIEVFLQLLVGNIDQLMMSHYSPQAVAAVANANQILNIFIMLIVVMSTATTILIAQYLGARNQSKLSEVCTVSLVLNFVFSSVAAVFFITCHEWIFTWLGIPPETMGDTSLYTTIVAAGLPIQAMYYALVAVFRGHSLTRITMYVALVMNIIHVGTNYILIFGHGPIPSLGVLGVSISTWLSKVIGLLIIVYLFKTLLHLKVSTSYLRPFPWHTVKSLLHISVPSGGETLSYQLSQTTIMKMVNILGLAVINTKVYVYVIAMLCYVYTIAIANASQVIVGFFMGAKRQNEVTNRVWKSMSLAIVISVGLAIFFYITSDTVLSVFTTDSEILSLAHDVLLVEIFLELGRAVNIVMVGCLQAAGDIRTPMLVGIFGMWLCAVPLSYLFGIYWGWGLVGIWIAMAADEILRGVLFIYRWYSGKWKEKRLIEV